MKQQVHLQSINDNHIQTSCAFNVKSKQVKHRGELGREYRERERDVANWGERERTAILRENGVGFRMRSTLVDFDRWSKSTQSIFRYHEYPYQHKDVLIHGKQTN